MVEIILETPLNITQYKNYSLQNDHKAETTPLYTTFLKKGFTAGYWMYLRIVLLTHC